MRPRLTFVAFDNNVRKAVDLGGKRPGGETGSPLLTWSNV